MLENLCLCEINLVHTYVASRIQYPMRNRGRAHCGMLYTKEGHEKYSFFDGSITAAPDTILIIPKGESYTIDLSDEKSVVVCVEFEMSVEADFRPFLIKTGRNNAVANLFTEAEKDWKRKKPGFNADCKAVIYKIIALICRQESRYLNTAGYEKIAESVDYLHKHCFENDFRLSKLAKMSNMSDRYYETLFFAEFNMTPKEYVLSLKIALAKELLTNERTTVSDVACLLGYADIYHFSKLFKMKTGYTPSQYKNRS